MYSDLRYAFRQLVKTPGFTLVALLTLALGIGANTAIFSLVNALLLRPLPYPEPDRIVQIGEVRGTSGPLTGADGGVFSDWEDQTTQLESISAFHRVERNLTGVPEPVRISGAEVSASYLRVLRVAPFIGRDFLASEDAPGGDRRVLVLSHEFWMSHFHGALDIVGRTIEMDGIPNTVVGIVPPGALLDPSVNFLAPATIRADAYKLVRNYNYPCLVIGRLKPGATPERAAAELTAARPGVLAQYPSFRQTWTIGVQSYQESLYGNVRSSAYTLLLVVGAVLLISCVNVANLLLARGVQRQGEISVRLALGASRGHILRQLLAESMLLSFLGGTAGLLLGSWAMQPLAVFTGLAGIPGLTLGLDHRVLFFTLGATVLTGLLVGALPALRASRTSLHDSMKEGARGSSSGAARRVQSVLIVAETTLTVVLLVCAGLLLRSFLRAMDASPGFNPTNALVFTLNPVGQRAATPSARVQFVQDVLRSIRSVPGVESAGMISATPMNGRIGFGEFVSREDQPQTRNDLNAVFNALEGDSLRALGIPLLRGRAFVELDNEPQSPRVMIINEALARRLFGDEDAIGRQLNFKNATWEVVGVVGNVRQYQLDLEPRPEVFLPAVHFPWYVGIVVRTHAAPESVIPDLRRAVHAVDPQQALANLTTLAQAVDTSLQNRRRMLTLLSLFAGLALLLSCVGVYGVLSYSVSQRTREIGIRMALGAGGPLVLKHVLAGGLKLILLGLVLGVPASYGAAQMLSTQLYGTPAHDAGVFLGVSLVLLAVALFACWLPARRATQVNPMVALRTE